MKEEVFMNAPTLNNKAVSHSGAVMVIGGGVAGVQAALPLPCP